MKLFYEKKLFGKINIVDIIIILIVIAVVVFGVNYFKKDVVASSGSESIEYTIEIKNISEATVNAIEAATNAQEQIIEASKKISLGNIKEISIEEYYDYSFNEEAEDYTFQRVPDKFKVYLTADGMASKMGDGKKTVTGYFFGKNFEVKIGKSLTITCSNFTAEGVIAKLNK